MSGSDDDAGSGIPQRRETAKYGQITFEQELAHIIRSRGKLFYLDLTDNQIDWITQNAGVIHRKHGGR